MLIVQFVVPPLVLHVIKATMLLMDYVQMYALYHVLPALQLGAAQLALLGFIYQVEAVWLVQPAAQPAHLIQIAHYAILGLFFQIKPAL